MLARVVCLAVAASATFDTNFASSIVMKRLEYELDRASEMSNTIARGAFCSVAKCKRRNESRPCRCGVPRHYGPHVITSFKNRNKNAKGQPGPLAGILR